MKKLPVLFAAVAACGDVVYTVVPNYPLEPECPPDLPKSTCEAFTPPGHRLLTAGGPASEAPFFVLDLDGNGVEDFRVVAYGLLSGQDLVGAGANASWSRPTPGPDIGSKLVALRKGDWVGPGLPAGDEWIETIPGAANFGTPLAPSIINCGDVPTEPPRRICNGLFQPGEPAYGGLRFDIGGNTHYGWVKLMDRGEGLTGAAIYIQEYAYETEPDTPIRIIPEPSVAGLLGTGALLLFLERRRTRFMNAGGRVPARKTPPNP